MNVKLATLASTTAGRPSKRRIQSVLSLGCVIVMLGTALVVSGYLPTRPAADAASLKMPIGERMVWGFHYPLAVASSRGQLRMIPRQRYAFKSRVEKDSGTVTSRNAYRLVILPPNGGRNSAAYAVNNRGTVVGLSQIPQSTSPELVTWNDTGHLTVRLQPDHGQYAVAPTGINDRGAISGASFAYDGSEEAAGYYSGGQWHDLDHLGCTSEADSINNAGLISGSQCLQNVSEWTAGQWAPSGASHTYRPLRSGLVDSYANDVSPLGDSVGFGYNKATDEMGATYWTRGQAAIQLGKAVNEGESAFSLSESITGSLRNVIAVGEGTDANNNLVPCYWKFKVSISAGLVGPEPRCQMPAQLKGFDSGCFVAVNQQGVAVGQAGDSLHPADLPHAIVWSGRGLVDLNSVVDHGSFLLLVATGINSSGVIVGDGALQGGHGPQRGYILMPVPQKRTPAGRTPETL